MSDTPYEWGNEHFCKEDATELYHSEPQRLDTIGFPVELDTIPETFCSVCLLWFTNPEHDNKEHHAQDTHADGPAEPDLL